MKYKLLLAGLVLSINSFADVPTMKEECLAVKAAICKVNNIEIHVNNVCPENTVTIKPLGNENCNDESVQQKVIENQSLKQKPIEKIEPPLDAKVSKQLDDNYWMFIGGVLGLMLLTLLTWGFTIMGLKNNPKNWKFNFGFFGGSLLINFFITKTIAINVFNKYGHDTIAPLIIASGYSVASFVGIGFICSVLFFTISKFIKK